MPIPAEQPTPETGLTANEIRILQKVRGVLPKPFLAKDAFGDANDIEVNRRILNYVQMVIDDINLAQPQTGYIVANFPEGLDTTLILGVNVFTAMFMQLKWTMNDISYTNNGFTVSIDRVGKLNTSYDTMFKMYERQVTNLKNMIMKQGVVVLGTPRFANTLGTFVRATFGTNF